MTLRNTGTSLSAPTNLQATQVGNSGTQIQLTWDYGSDRIDGFKIERQTPSERQTNAWDSLYVAPSAGPPGHWYLIDTSVMPYATNSYRVRAYKGSEESANSDVSTCFQLHAFVVTQPVIDATFTPDLDAALPSPLDAVAGTFGYDHFEWINWVDYVPSKTNWKGLDGKHYTAPRSFFDPPNGGWAYVDKNGLPTPLPADDLPFYWNEKLGFPSKYTYCGPASICNARNLTTLIFEDTPGDSLLDPNNPFDFIGFTTELVGVRSNGTWEPLHNFVWYSNFNPKTLTGGIELFRSFNLKTLDGTGGVFNVQQNVPTEDLPLELRTAMIQSGGLNVTTAPKVDKDDVITSAASQRPSLEMTQYPAVRINSI